MSRLFGWSRLLSIGAFLGVLKALWRIVADLLGDWGFRRKKWRLWMIWISTGTTNHWNILKLPTTQCVGWTFAWLFSEHIWRCWTTYLIAQSFASNVKVWYIICGMVIHTIMGILLRYDTLGMHGYGNPMDWWPRTFPETLRKPHPQVTARRVVG
jgi:hypothetical protein